MNVLYVIYVCHKIVVWILFIFLSHMISLIIYYMVSSFAHYRMRKRMHIWWLSRRLCGTTIVYIVSVVCHQSRGLIASSATVTTRQPRRENSRKNKIKTLAHCSTTRECDDVFPRQSV